MIVAYSLASELSTVKPNKHGSRKGDINLVFHDIFITAIKLVELLSTRSYPVGPEFNIN